MTAMEPLPPQPVVGVADDRIKRISQAGRVVHRVILRAFAATGEAPTTDALQTATTRDTDVGAALAELHQQDIICLDDAGRLRAAYPFSAAPTQHLVDIADGPTVHAMCAVDALGIAEMLGRDVTIRSVDSDSGDPITVVVKDGRPVWQPDTAVVYVGAFSSSAPCEDQAVCAVQPAADGCCTVMNFFADSGSAARWQSRHPEVTGAVLDQDQALRRGVEIFGGLLTE